MITVCPLKFNIMHPDIEFYYDPCTLWAIWTQSIQHTTGQLTHTRRSDSVPELDDKEDPIIFMTLTVDTQSQTVFMM
jgi:hypothetical protein